MATRHRARVVDFGEKKIHAIKLVRELTAVGLREAKDIVEQHLEFEFELDRRTQTLLDEAHAHAIMIERQGDAHVAGTMSAHGAASAGASLQSGAGCAIRYVSGPNKIHAIKLVRELWNGLGLMEAKTLVEEYGVICSGISRVDAEQIASSFAAIGSQVQIIGDGGYEDSDDDF
jgi:ribosomal protein L7/L12